MNSDRSLSALRWLGFTALAVCALSWPTRLDGQGVTTGNISGVVTDAQKQPVAGATVIAIHEPSGTNYDTTTRADGRYVIANMRVGGPYTIKVVYSGAGNAAFAPQTKEDIIVNLGLSTDVNVEVQAITVSEEITVSGQADPVFASSRTGAATQVSRDDIQNLPTISGRISDLTRLTPQSSGNSFSGQDSRSNNIQVDGSSSCSASTIRSISRQYVGRVLWTLRRVVRAWSRELPAPFPVARTLLARQKSV
ncbi:MAG: carboxypeptidase regulatory-like domain-containing protein [Acidobacteria bacterium]|nr:carboxypeptidase regulatory-like domain-containing protein [Acidobacteriota bacterium]